MGKPTAATVFCEFTESSGHSLYWTKAGSRTTDESRCIHANDILQVLAGKQTKTFQKFKKAKDELCFSVVSKTRSLDLEAHSTQQRDIFVSVLKTVIASPSAVEFVSADSVQSPEKRTDNSSLGQFSVPSSPAHAAVQSTSRHRMDASVKADFNQLYHDDPHSKFEQSESGTRSRGNSHAEEYKNVQFKLACR